MYNFLIVLVCEKTENVEAYTGVYYFAIPFTCVYFVKFFSDGGGGAMISTVYLKVFVFGYKCNNEYIYGNNYLRKEPMSEDRNSLG
jgi:hypothetical protein